MDTHLVRDIVEDEMRLASFNFGFLQDKPYYSVEFGQQQASAWTNYSEGSYRFFGVQMFMSADRTFTQRKTYGQGEMLSEIGGLVYALEIIFLTCIVCCQPTKLFALMTNRLYKDDANEPLIQSSEDRLDKMKSKLGSEEDLQKSELVVPSCMNVRPFFCGCCPSKEYKKFRHQSANTKEEIIANLDVVKLIQRTRMHGIALRLLMTPDIATISSHLGFKRDIWYTEKVTVETETQNEDTWDNVENINSKT